MSPSSLTVRMWAVPTLILLAMAPPAEAQDTPLGTTWFVHGFTATDGAGSFLNFLPPEGEADQTATNTAAAGGDFRVRSSAEAPLAAAMIPAEGGPAEAKLWLKSWNNAPAPMTEVIVTVSADGEAIATGSLTKDVLLGAIVEYVVPLTTTVTSLPAGTEVDLEVVIQDHNCGCYNPAAYARGTSMDHPWQFTLPLAFEALEVDVGGIEHQLLTGPNVTLDVEFPNATTEMYSYTWPSNLTDLVFHYGATVLAGAANLVVTDAANSTVLDVNYTASSNGTLVVPNAAIGNWTILIGLTAFEGSLNLHMAAPAPVLPTEPVVAGNATTDDAEDKDSPGLPFLGLALMLVLGALVARRT